MNLFLKNSPDVKESKILNGDYLEVGKIYRDVSPINDSLDIRIPPCFLRFEGYDGRSYLFTWVAGSNYYSSEDRVLDGSIIENAIPFSGGVTFFYLATDSDVKKYNLI